MSPGVQLPSDESGSAESGVRTGTDSMGQQYHSPHDVIGVRGSDIVIVGRAILRADDPAAESRRYQEAAWHAYEESLAASMDAQSQQ